MAPNSHQEPSPVIDSSQAASSSQAISGSHATNSSPLVDLVRKIGGSTVIDKSNTEFSLKNDKFHCY